MKARIGSLEIEGTPDEIAALIRSLPFEIKELAAPSEPPTLASKFVSEEVAYRALTRIRLSSEQVAVISSIYHAHPEWVWATDLQKQIGYSANQFAGLMGAFGRRLTNTPGYVQHTVFFEQEWDATRECFRYRLPDSVRAAFKRAALDLIG